MPLPRSGQEPMPETIRKKLNTKLKNNMDSYSSNTSSHSMIITIQKEKPIPLMDTYPFLDFYVMHAVSEKERKTNRVAAHQKRQNFKFQMDHSGRLLCSSVTRISGTTSDSW